MKRAGYALGFAAALWSIYALVIYAITVGDVGGLLGLYSGAAWMYKAPVLWFVLFAALACGAIVRLFRGQPRGAERITVLLLIPLSLISVFGWAIITALVAAV